MVAVVLALLRDPVGSSHEPQQAPAKHLGGSQKHITRTRMNRRPRCRCAGSARLRISCGMHILVFSSTRAVAELALAFVLRSLAQKCSRRVSRHRRKRRRTSPMNKRCVRIRRPTRAPIAAQPTGNWTVERTESLSKHALFKNAKRIAQATSRSLNAFVQITKQNIHTPLTSVDINQSRCEDGLQVTEHESRALCYFAAPRIADR